MIGASNDNLAGSVALDQYYTDHAVARDCYSSISELYDAASLLLIEPSAGTGSFYRLMAPGSLAYDVEPKYPGIETRDFLTVEPIVTDQHIACIGNPPFGKNSSMAVRFFTTSLSPVRA